MSKWKTRHVLNVPAFGPVAHGFVIMAVGSDHQGAVVVRVVLRANAGRAVVVAAGSKARGMECPTLLPVLGSEGDVDRAGAVTE